uniref:Cytochrome b n=1 Tax=Riccardoella reaumuri TaxID=2803873 RepID=A0A7R7Z699_9ACAR|nr:cytochrome B [Riccardoella reaumuri]
MKNQIKNTNSITKMLFNMMVSLPAPSSISYMWNWGSMLGIMMFMQIMTGLLLASHYNPSIMEAFNSIIHINREINNGWMLRFLHMNGSSILFIMIYMHISRGMLFNSFKMMNTWMSGLIMLLLLMGISFLGYVLPWGQMSFWGATVITNLATAIPYLGESLVKWLWGGFSINNATLNRFFMLHFLMPFMLLMMIIIHLAFLHLTGSSTPLGLNNNKDKIPFYPYFIVKDMMSLFMLLMMIFLIMFINPNIMSDPENFNMANPLSTPMHIQPEWYFLFAYAILRSIPSKLGGVMALLMSIMSLMMLPFMKKMTTSSKFMPIKKYTFWLFSMNFIILSWIGANPVEYPFEMTGKIFSMTYFMLLFMLCFFLFVLKTKYKVML